MMRRQTPRFQVAIQIRDGNPNHHIWLNNGVWFLHYSIRLANGPGRIRHSLGTKDVKAARRRRDHILAKLIRKTA